MKTKRKRILWSAILALTVAIGLVRYRPQHEPIARMALPDGTELRLEYVTYGTEHRVPGAGHFKSWLLEKAQFLPGVDGPVPVAEYEYQSAETSLCLWFTCFDPKSREFLRGVHTDLAVEGADPGATIEPSVSDYVREKFGMYYDQMLPMPHALFTARSYDRRKAELPLRVTSQGKTATFVVRNPLAKVQFPIWQAEPLPQTRRVGDLEVVLRALTASRRSPGSAAASDDDDTSHAGEKPGLSSLTFFNPPAEVETEIAVLHDGREVPGLRFDDGLKIFDATGNEGDERHPPSYAEAVWKIQKTAMHTEDFPFAVTDGVVFGQLAMPEAGKGQLLGVPAERRKEGFRIVALLGPGNYTLQEGAVLGSGRPLSPKEFDDLPAADRDTVIINTPVPVVAILFVAPEPQWDTAGGTFHTVRAWRDGRGSKMEQNGAREDPWNVDSHHTFAEDASVALEIYDFGPDGTSAPHADTPVSIQIVPLQRETVEFLVAPPKLSATTAGEKK
jgi:hypothetical protein